MNETIDHKFLAVDDSQIPDFAQRRAECNQDGGHKAVTWLPYSSESGIREVEGICTYCLTSLSRSLTYKERFQEEGFYNGLKEPMDL